jgi:hypothetical protein
MAFPPVAVIAALLFVLPISVQAQIRVTDLGDLNLRVADVKVVPELPLSGSPSGPQFQVRAEQGLKFVAVTLTGELRAPGRYVVWPQLFAVLFEEERAQMGPTVKVAGAHHVAMPGDPVEWAASYATEATRPGPVTIRFAVTVPQAVESLQVLYATGIKDVVKLGAQIDQRPTHIDVSRRFLYAMRASRSDVRLHPRDDHSIEPNVFRTAGDTSR